MRSGDRLRFSMTAEKPQRDNPSSTGPPGVERLGPPLEFLPALRRLKRIIESICHAA